MDGLTQSQNPRLDTKSKPWMTQGLVPNSSDPNGPEVKLELFFFNEEKKCLHQKKLSGGKGDKNCRGDVGDWENVIM